MEKWSKYIYAIVILLLASCTSEETQGPDPVPGTNDDVTILIEFPSESQGFATKALDENGIDKLDILVFTPGTDSQDPTTDVFAYRIKRGSSEITTVAANKKQVTAALKRNQSQRLVLLANLPTAVTTWLDNNLTEGTTTLATILPNLTYSGSPWGSDKATLGETPFPMWGQENTFSTISPTGTPSGKTIKMIRTVSKIKVSVDKTDPALGFGSLFNIEEIHVCNSVPNGYISPTDGELGLERVTKPKQGTGTRVNIQYSKNDSIYIPECDTLEGGNTPTFLVVKAKYYNDSFYYRIDFANGGQAVPLLRNHSYHIKISGIRTNGYLTFADAYNAPASNLIFSITIGESATDPDQVTIDAIKYNDQYMLGTSSKAHVKLDWIEYLKTPYQLPVMTTYNGGWKAEVVSGSDWLALGNTSGGADAVTYLNLIAEANMTLGTRTAQINLTAGTLTLPVTVTQIIGSNSYIVKSGGTVLIPVNSANLSGDLLSGASNLKVKVLWNEGSSITIDATPSPISSSTLLNVTAGSDFGNAVIALTKQGSGIGMVGGTAADEIVWSWHVWITDAGYDPISSQRPNNGYLFMNRNLGAAGVTGYGLYYQWGRKDPFHSSVASGNIEAPSSNNLKEAIQNPQIFYNASVSPYDWIGTSQHNNLWNTIDGEKAAYDPCPFGWRVPVVDSEDSSPWKGISSNSSNGLYFPLAGGLSMTDGQVTDDESQGYVWGASARGISAFVFTCTSGSASQTQAYRANAYQVRCVRDVKR